MDDVRFGTDGWRGVIADEFTVERLRRVIQAVMSYVTREKRSPLILIGHDTRFLSDYYARVAAEVAAGAGAKALIDPRPVTTPMLSYAVFSQGAEGGIMITASHNPYDYSGVKFKAGYGGSAVPRITREIESFLGKSPASATPYDKAREEGAVTETDFFPPYRKRMGELINVAAIREAGFTAALDCMHGSIGGHVRMLREGLGLAIKPLRPERDPYFGGVNPDPVEEHLDRLKSTVREGGFDIGIAVDGDADRFSVVDAEGVCVSPHYALALLVLHMNRNRGESGMVVKTVSTSSIVDRVAHGLGLPVRETPVGFKHICEAMLADDVLIGGEENGGVGIKGHIPERDGLLAALLLMEMMAVEGKSLGNLVSEVEKLYGRSYYRRLDLPMGGAERIRAFREIKDGARSVFAGFGVKDVKTQDGVKVILADGSWALFRPSGTEPVLRVYCEAPEEARLEDIVARAKEAFLGQGGHRG